MAKEIISILGDNLSIGWLLVITVVLSLIEISPVKINPWKAIWNFFTANQKILDKIDVMEERMERIEEDALEERAIEARVRILRFGDEILHKTKHTKENFEQTLNDIQEYENYCANHPNFKNQVTVMHAKLIKERYERCLNGTDSFLPYYEKDDDSIN